MLKINDFKKEYYPFKSNVLKAKELKKKLSKCKEVKIRITSKSILITYCERPFLDDHFVRSMDVLTMIREYDFIGD